MLTDNALLTRDDLECLLEALAGCPRLRGLDLTVDSLREAEDDDGPQRPFLDASTFAKLTSLTKLALHVGYETDAMTLIDVVGALVPLTGLAELSLGLLQPAVVPAATLTIYSGTLKSAKQSMAQQLVSKSRPVLVGSRAS